MFHGRAIYFLYTVLVVFRLGVSSTSALDCLSFWVIISGLLAFYYACTILTSRMDIGRTGRTGLDWIGSLGSSALLFSGL